MTEHFGLDEYTYNLLIDYFKSKPEIKYVWIFGSRVLGTSRKSSDIDLLFESTIEDPFYLPYKKELNKLKHPYKIDIISINSDSQWIKEFAYLVKKDTKILYKREEYFPNEEFYKSTFIGSDIIEDKGTRWIFRYKRSINRIFYDYKSQLEQVINNIENNILDIEFKNKFLDSFKHIFEGCWKTTKDYLNSFNIHRTLPRDIFDAAYEQNIISNLDIWHNMITDFNIMTDERLNIIFDELLYRIKNIYYPEIENLYIFYKNKCIESGVEIS